LQTSAFGSKKEQKFWFLFSFEKWNELLFQKSIFLVEILDRKKRKSPTKMIFFFSKGGANINFHLRMPFATTWKLTKLSTKVFSGLKTVFFFRHFGQTKIFILWDQNFCCAN
jgi:hypothetical protein